MQIKHTLLLAITSLLAMLVLPVHADTAVVTMVFGTSTSGIRDMSRQDIELNYNLAFANFSNIYAINTKLKVFDSHAALMAAFDQGEIDGIIGLGTDILAREDQLKSRKSVIVYGNGQYKLRYLLLVRKADNISSIEQLKGKSISIPGFQEVESMYLDTLLLRRKQAEATQFFSKIINAANSNTTITDLFFNRVEAAIVNENEYQIAKELNPQIAQNISILEQSEPLVLSIGALRKTTPTDLETRTLNAAIDFPKTEAGRNLYKMLGMKSMQVLYPNDLDTLRALKNEYEQLKNAANQKSALAIEKIEIQQRLGKKSNTATAKMQKNEKAGAM